MQLISSTQPRTHDAHPPGKLYQPMHVLHLWHFASLTPPDAFSSYLLLCLFSALQGDVHDTVE